MTAKSTYLADNLLDHTLRNESYTAPTNVYLALIKENGDEVDAGSYARQEITFTAASNGETVNDGDITFPVAQEDWGNVTDGEIYDADSAGNMLYESVLDNSKDIETDDQFIVQDGEAKVTES